MYRTAEQQDVRVSVVARGLEYPYSLAFLPGGELLVTERPGRLRIIRNGVLDPRPIAGGPASRFAGKSGAIGAVHGYMSLVVHPRFAENHWIYFSYTKPLDDKRATVAVARARLEGGTMRDVRDVFVGDNLRGAASLAMTPDGMLWIATGGEGAQDPKSLTGKVLRLRDDGSVPPDNPFVGREDYRPEIYTLGHRAALGLAVHPATHEVWLSEMGPNGGDEINILKPGRNYGWPLVSLGRTYPGPWQAKANQPTHEGFEPPVVYWMPADFGRRPHLLHGRQAAQVEGRPVRGRPAHRRGPRHRPPGSRSVQRQDGRAAPRVAAGRSAPAHPRRETGAGWLAVRGDR